MDSINIIWLLQDGTGMTSDDQKKPRPLWKHALTKGSIRPKLGEAIMSVSVALFSLFSDFCLYRVCKPLLEPWVRLPWQHTI